MPMGFNSESQSDLGLDPGALDRVMYLGLMPLLLFLLVIPCVLFSRLRGMVRDCTGPWENGFTEGQFQIPQPFDLKPCHLLTTF